MTSTSELLDRILEPLEDSMSVELAEAVLTLDFPQRDHKRYLELSTKAQDGSLTDDETAELDRYLNVNDFVSILKSIARQTLKRKPRTSAA